MMKNIIMADTLMSLLPTYAMAFDCGWDCTEDACDVHSRWYVCKTRCDPNKIKGCMATGAKKNFR